MRRKIKNETQWLLDVHQEWLVEYGGAMQALKEADFKFKEAMQEYNEKKGSLFLRRAAAAFGKKRKFAAQSF